MTTVHLCDEELAILHAAMDYGAAALARNRCYAERDARAHEARALDHDIPVRGMTRHPLYRAVVAANRAEAVSASLLLVLEAAYSALPDNFTPGVQGGGRH